MLEYFPFLDQAQTDLYAIDKQLRAEAPVYYLGKFDAWGLSTLEDVWATSMDMKYFTATDGDYGRSISFQDIPGRAHAECPRPAGSHPNSFGDSILLRTWPPTAIRTSSFTWATGLLKKARPSSSRPIRQSVWLLELRTLQ